MNYSPIILFTYKRLETLQRCIPSLQKCSESKFSDLIIVSDYAFKKADLEKVMAVRQYLKSITGFKSVEIIEREINLGVDYNIIEGIKHMADRFEQFIVVEDDLVVQDNFLSFLNYSLDFYANNPDVLSVSGFTFLNTMPKDYLYDAYFAKRTCPWGWATWSKKIKDVDWEILDKEEFLNSRKLQEKFNEWGSDRSRMFIATLKNKIRAWDIRLDYHQFKNELCTLYPVTSFVENIGFDNFDASNCFGYNRYKTKLKRFDKSTFLLPTSVLYNKKISKKFISKNSISQRIFTKLMKYFIILKQNVEVLK